MLSGFAQWGRNDNISQRLGKIHPRRRRQFPHNTTLPLTLSWGGLCPHLVAMCCDVHIEKL